MQRLGRTLWGLLVLKSVWRGSGSFNLLPSFKIIKIQMDSGMGSGLKVNALAFPSGIYR